MAGNTIVFKPSEKTPLTGEFLTQCWEKAELPPGVLNLLQGGITTAQLCLKHPQLDGIFFTGSWETGKAIAELFASQPYKMLALEMGGNNPLLVEDFIDPEAAASLIIQSAFLTAGQRCSCARRLILIDNAKMDSFLNQLVTMTKSLLIGPYTDSPEPFMGPVINMKMANDILAKQRILHAKGGKILVEAKCLKENRPFLSPGIMDVTEVQNRQDEEIFGPFLQVIRVQTLTLAIEEANKTAYGLTAGLLSPDPEKYRQFFLQVRAGIINWNMPLTGSSSEAPFGGIGKSGNHRPGAYYAADYCSYPVASLESPKIKPASPYVFRNKS